MWLITLLKVTKNQRFTLTLEDAFLKKPQTRDKLTPNLFRAFFADITKIVTMFIKTIFKDSKKVKRIRNSVPKYNLYLYFLIQQNFLIYSEKMLNSRGVLRDSYLFGICHR